MGGNGGRTRALCDGGGVAVPPALTCVGDANRETGMGGGGDTRSNGGEIWRGGLPLPGVEAEGTGTAAVESAPACACVRCCSATMGDIRACPLGCCCMTLLDRRAGAKLLGGEGNAAEGEQPNADDAENDGGGPGARKGPSIGDEERCSVAAWRLLPVCVLRSLRCFPRGRNDREPERREGRGGWFGVRAGECCVCVRVSLLRWLTCLVVSCAAAAAACLMSGGAAAPKERLPHPARRRRQR